MKILFIITRADTVGGAQVHVRDLASNLQQQGDEVIVMTGIEGMYNKVLKQNQLKNVSCPDFHQNISPIKDAKTVRFIVELIRSFHPDLISTHSSKAGILGRIAARLTKKKCLFTAHGWAFTDGVPEPTRSIYRFIEQRAEPFADRIICVSNHDRLIGIKAGLSSERLVTIHNGMPDIDKRWVAKPENGNPVVITMIARFDQQKDHVSLFKAVQNISGIQLKLVGDGPKLGALKNYANQLGINHFVSFLGYQNDVTNILSESHIFTLISHWEGFPLTIVEAMRAGLPVVASNVGGVSEAVQEGVSGFCIPRNDVKILRDRLLRLIQDNLLRKKMGNQSRLRYEQEFTFQRMFSQTNNVYQQVINRKSYA